MKTYHYLVTGKVQGVWYRDTIKQAAQKLDLTGWVKNLADGSVELIVTGSEKQLTEFAALLWKGSATSAVLNVTKHEVNLQMFADFQVTF